MTRDEADANGRSIILFGQAGIGKTTFASNFPSAVFLPAASEQGARELEASGVLDGVRQLRPFEDFNDLEDRIRSVMRAGKEEVGTLVIETVQHALDACIATCLAEKFDGDDGESRSGFNNFGKGYKTTKTHYVQPLRDMLDRVRAKGIHVVLTGHTEIGTRTNPDGDDFAVETPSDMNEKLWKVFEKWCEAMMLYTLDVNTDENSTRMSKVTDYRRALIGHVEPRFNGKTRWGLSERVFDTATEDEPDLDGSKLYAAFCKEARIDPETLAHVR